MGNIKTNSKGNRLLAFALSLLLVFSLTACSKDKEENKTGADTKATKTVIDITNRTVEIPKNVKSVVCINVGALRYTCYMGAQNLVTGIEDYDKEGEILRPYSHVNHDLFKDLPVVGTNGTQYHEAIIDVNPDVIVMKTMEKSEADNLQEKTGIPVVAIPGSDQTLDKNAFDTINILGEVYNKQDRAKELTAYLKSVQKDLNDRTKDIKDQDKPSVYVGGVSFKGHHGFDGTEANYGPLALINAKNLANTTGEEFAFNIDLEKVLEWDPDIILIDFNGMPLIKEDYAKNPKFYDSLSAFKEGKVYSQISFRSCASNLDTALIDAYYAGSVIYPDKFKDVDIDKKAEEIFTKLLSKSPYEDLKEQGYEFRAVTLR